MAGWSYMLCYFDHECRPFGGAWFGNVTTAAGYAFDDTLSTNVSLLVNETTLSAAIDVNVTKPTTELI